MIEIGLEFTNIGRTSISFSCEVRNVFTKQTIIKIDNIVFVKVDENGIPEVHGKNLQNLKLTQ